MSDIKKSQISGINSSPDKLHDFLITHLNRLHCAKAHLSERLPEIAGHAGFSDLKNAIIETYDDINKQLMRMNEIWDLLLVEPDMETCNDLIDYLEEGFDQVFRQKDDVGMRDLAILFYLSIIESIEMTSFQMLKMASTKLADKQISILLQKNFDESKADRALFLQIADKFIG